MTGDSGAVTVEAAFAILSLVAVLVVCAAGLTAVSMQVRCVDAAREAARLAARGDDAGATAAARKVAPADAAVDVRRDGEFVVATVTSTSALLPGLKIAARGVSALEPDG
ncbi:TadE family type IV pilus minor pilin [Mycolicibacterium chubuense]|uniref:TadE family type IV pilus minor pilin n=1 Tax=Mycolicibacterium chubuense TaxID=1800 RepID=UPI00193DCB71|nr:TadE family type IV pilus minor pilin [Mycolicibacterium chubuense]